MSEPIHLTVEQFSRFSASDRLSLRRFGQQTEPVETDVTLAAGVVSKLLNSDSDRVTWTMSNSGGSNAASISGFQSLVAATGSVIGANGGAAARDALDDGSVVGREVFGFSTSGTTMHVTAVRTYGPTYILPEGIPAI